MAAVSQRIIPAKRRRSCANAFTAGFVVISVSSSFVASFSSPPPSLCLFAEASASMCSQVDCAFGTLVASSAAGPYCQCTCDENTNYAPPHCFYTRTEMQRVMIGLNASAATGYKGADGFSGDFLVSELCTAVGLTDVVACAEKIMVRHVRFEDATTSGTSSSLAATIVCSLGIQSPYVPQLLSEAHSGAGIGAPSLNPNPWVQRVGLVSIAALIPLPVDEGAGMMMAIPLGTLFKQDVTLGSFIWVIAAILMVIVLVSSDWILFGSKGGLKTRRETLDEEASRKQRRSTLLSGQVSSLPPPAADGGGAAVGVGAFASPPTKTTAFDEEGADIRNSFTFPNSPKSLPRKRQPNNSSTLCDSGVEHEVSVVIEGADEGPVGLEAIEMNPLSPAVNPSTAVNVDGGDNTNDHPNTIVTGDEGEETAAGIDDSAHTVNRSQTNAIDHPTAADDSHSPFHSQGHREHEEEPPHTQHGLDVQTVSTTDFAADDSRGGAGSNTEDAFLGGGGGGNITAPAAVALKKRNVTGSLKDEVNGDSGRESVGKGVMDF